MAYNVQHRMHANHVFFFPQLLVAFTIIASNLLLIHTIRKTNKLKVITFKLIYVLSIADIMAGVEMITIAMMRRLNGSKDYFTRTQFLVTVGEYPLAFFTTRMILLISVDRYLHLTRMNYSLIITHRRANILVLCNALFAVFEACILGITHNHFKFYVGFLTFVYLMCLVCIIIVIVLYHKALRSIRNRIHNGTLARENRNIRNAGRDVSKAVFMTLACLLSTMIPSLLLSPLPMYMPSQQWTYMAMYATGIIYYLNSTLNAVIIIYFSRDLRNCIKHLFLSNAQVN